MNKVALERRNIVKELKLDPKKPLDLYQLLNAVSLSAARIRTGNAMQGSKALIDAGLTSPDKVLEMPYWDRVRVLNQHGYARYDESRARFLEDNAQLVKDKYQGNLHNLLREAGHKKHKVREAIQQFKGIGPTGANIFLREINPHVKLSSVNTESFYKGILDELQKQATLVPPVQQKKKPNNFWRNTALGLGGAAALGAGIYGLNKGMKPVAAPKPITPPTTTPAQPDYKQLIDQAVATGKAEEFTGAFQRSIEGQNPLELNPTASTAMTAGAFAPMVGAAAGSKLGQKVPGVNSVGRALNKELFTLDPSKAGPAIKNLGKLEQPLAKGLKFTGNVGGLAAIPASMYYNYNDDNIGNYWQDRFGLEHNQLTGKAIQTGLGAGEGALWLLPGGQIPAVGNMATRMMLDHAGNVQDDVTGKGATYSKLLGFMDNMMRSQNPAESEHGKMLAKYLLEKHQPEINQLANPDWWTRARMSSYGLGPKWEGDVALQRLANNVQSRL